jgi:predicted DNA-binding protein (UPF0251 family)
MAQNTRPGTGKAKRTQHLETPGPESRPAGGGAQSGNPNGQRRTWNAEQLKERRIDALRLRVNGIEYRQIGEKLGVSAQTAWQDVKKELSAQAVEAAMELRALEYGRLSKAYAKAMEVMDAASGEMALKAVDRVERLSRSMRVLFGLDVPVRIDVTHHELSQQDVELQELLNEATAANATELAKIADERTDAGS